MTYTENFNLLLPGGQDPPDIEPINQNMEIIDEKLGKAILLVVSGDDIEEGE